MTVSQLSGYWRSHYRYPSKSRAGEFENDHLVQLKRDGNQIIFETVPKKNKSYLILRLSINDDVATGTWQEETETDGYYRGAVYSGAIQLVISEDGKRMTGKWVGFGKNMEVNTGPWEFTYLGESLPSDE